MRNHHSRRTQQDEYGKRRTVRQLAALEARNQAAAGALERFFQTADAEARVNLARDAGPILDDLFDKAAGAKKANLRYPLEPDDVSRQRAALAAQVDQAEAAIDALNIDLRRRLALPYAADERLWPVSDFAVDPDTGWTNVGIRRLMLRGRRTAGIDLVAPSDLRAISIAHSKRGERLRTRRGRTPLSLGRQSYCVKTCGTSYVFG